MLRTLPLTLILVLTLTACQPDWLNPTTGRNNHTIEGRWTQEGVLTEGCTFDPLGHDLILNLETVETTVTGTLTIRSPYTTSPTFTGTFQGTLENDGTLRGLATSTADNPTNTTYDVTAILAEGIALHATITRATPLDCNGIPAYPSYETTLNKDDAKHEQPDHDTPTNPDDENDTPNDNDDPSDTPNDNDAPTPDNDPKEDLPGLWFDPQPNLTGCHLPPGRLVDLELAHNTTNNTYGGPFTLYLFNEAGLIAQIDGTLHLQTNPTGTITGNINLPTSLTANEPTPLTVTGQHAPGELTLTIETDHERDCQTNPTPHFWKITTTNTPY